MTSCNTHIYIYIYIHTHIYIYIAICYNEAISGTHMRLPRSQSAKVKDLGSSPVNLGSYVTKPKKSHPKKLKVMVCDIYDFCDFWHPTSQRKVVQLLQWIGVEILQAFTVEDTTPLQLYGLKDVTRPTEWNVRLVAPCKPPRCDSPSKAFGNGSGQESKLLRGEPASG